MEGELRGRRHSQKGQLLCFCQEYTHTSLLVQACTLT